MAVHDPNPLKELLLDEGATLFPYGVEPAEPGAVRRVEAGEGAGTPPLLAAAFGAIELEYASLRTDCVVMDRPDRAVIEVWGYDSREFLGRMLTQDVARLDIGHSCNSFWLNRKGRIDADVRVTRRAPDGDDGDIFHVDLETGSVEHFIKTLSAYVITESVRFNIRTRAQQLGGLTHERDNPSYVLHRLSVHGPKAADLLLATTAPHDDDRILGLEPDRSLQTSLGEIGRHDTAGVPGYELLVRDVDAAEVYRTLLRFGRPEFMDQAAEFASSRERGAAIAAKHHSPPETRCATPESIRLRPCGWFAYNIARIEAGTPLFKVDFGPDNLPAETGVIDDRINFKKGCYLGQEIVARMHARGHPKQRLVALRFEDDLPISADGLPPLPVQGDPVISADDPGKALGSITSSTFSPMLGRVPIALAMVAWSHVEPGSRVHVETEGRRIVGTVQKSLRFLP